MLVLDYEMHYSVRYPKFDWNIQIIKTNFDMQETQIDQYEHLSLEVHQYEYLV